MTIKRYQLKILHNFQSAALKEKGNAIQISLLENALKKRGESFVHWLEEQMREISNIESNADIITGDEDIILPDIPSKYTAQEFKNPPPTTASIMWDSWKDITPGVLCSSTVWGYIVSQFIKLEKIEPYFLMVGRNGGHTDGKKEIEEALKKTGEGKNKFIDNCTRSFLRKFSGLQIIRGTRSIYQDCPPAMAWWQCYIANDAANNAEVPKEKIIELFHKTGVWETFSDKMASQLTIIGDKNIRDGLILFFLDENKKMLLNRDNIIKIFNAVGVMSAWRALGFFSPHDIKKIIENEIVPTMSFLNETENETKNAS